MRRGESEGFDDKNSRWSEYFGQLLNGETGRSVGEEDMWGRNGGIENVLGKRM